MPRSWAQFRLLSSNANHVGQLYPSMLYLLLTHILRVILSEIAPWLVQRGPDFWPLLWAGHILPTSTLSYHPLEVFWGFQSCIPAIGDNICCREFVQYVSSGCECSATREWRSNRITLQAPIVKCCKVVVRIHPRSTKILVQIWPYRALQAVLRWRLELYKWDYNGYVFPLCESRRSYPFLNAF